MNITRENIDPFMDVPTGKEALVDAWLTSISAILTARFEPTPPYDPDVVPAAIAPAVYDIVAQAIVQRLTDEAIGSGRDPRVKAQAINGASVQYFDSAQFSSWFDPFVLADLNALFGVGSVRSTRTPAPDAVRYGNLVRNDEWLEAPIIPIEAAI